uniref:Uncharacterized protein n=1 Tax=Strigamia maritima TaxID=126957 RepID=T1IPV8_STRMM
MGDCIRLACERLNNAALNGSKRSSKLVTPGDLITNDTGHGTYDNDQCLLASVAGVVKQVGRLISVVPLKTRYNGEIGDRIVGRITEVQQKRWKVDTNSKMDSILQLSFNTLPGGESRRRGMEDELMMRQCLKEGDLISAEVHKVHNDGVLSLIVKDLKSGKLSQGSLVRVSPSVIKRCKLHVHDLPFGVNVILGNNGLIWISCKTREDTTDGVDSLHDLEPNIEGSDREIAARIRNCILALANSRVMLYDTSIIYAYEESLKYSEAKHLLKPEVIADVAECTRRRLSEMES